LTTASVRDWTCSFSYTVCRCARNGAQGEAELIGDFLVEKTLRQERENLLFALGELFHVRLRLFDLMEMVHHLRAICMDIGAPPP